MNRWGPLILILIGTLLLGGLYGLTVFPGYGPDELSHFGYVKVVAEEHRLPVLGRDNDPDGPSYESHQPPLYYLLATPFYFVGKSILGAKGAWLGVRFFTLLCGLGAVALVYALALRLFPDEPAVAIGAAGFAGFLPSQIMLFAVANNDALTELGFTLTLYLLALYLLSENPSKKSPVWIGISTALVFLTKASALVLLVVIPVVLLWSRAGKESLPTGERFKPILHFGLGCLLCLPWLIRNQSLYGDPIAWGAFKQYFLVVHHSPTPITLGQRIGIPYSPVWYWKDAVLDWAFRDSLGMWLFTQIGKTVPIKVSLDPSLYLMWGIGWVAALAGTVRFTFTEFRLKPKSWRWEFIALFATLILLFIAYLRLNMVFYWAQSRYLFPAIATLALLWSVGISCLLPARFRAYAMWSINIGLFLVTFYAGFVLLGGFFERVAAGRI